MGKVYRLGQIARRLNIGIVTICDLLASEGIKIICNPNAKINEQEVDILAKKLARENFKTALEDLSETSSNDLNIYAQGSFSLPLPSSKKLIISAGKDVFKRELAVLLDKIFEVTDQDPDFDCFNPNTIEAQPTYSGLSLFAILRKFFRDTTCAIKRLIKGYKPKIRMAFRGFRSVFSDLILRTHLFYVFPEEEKGLKSLAINDFNTKIFHTWTNEKNL